jgi:hypothetical protein
VIAHDSAAEAWGNLRARQRAGASIKNAWPKVQALAQAAGLLGRDDDAGRQVLGQLWDAAFEEGRLDALDELQDRFCVCMK